MVTERRCNGVTGINFHPNIEVKEKIHEFNRKHASMERMILNDNPILGKTKTLPIAA